MRGNPGVVRRLVRKSNAEEGRERGKPQVWARMLPRA